MEVRNHLPPTKSWSTIHGSHEVSTILASKRTPIKTKHTTMPADRTKRSARAGPSTTKPKAKKYALPPIAGAGDEADVHAARSRAVAVGAVADLDEEEEDGEEEDGEEEDDEGMEMEDGKGAGEGNDDPTQLGEEDGGAKRKEKGKGKAAVKGKKRKSPGIVYISRLPPGMTPHKVRHLMAKWGEVGRVYAQHRDGESRQRRRGAGDRGGDMDAGSEGYANTSRRWVQPGPPQEKGTAQERRLQRGMGRVPGQERGQDRREHVECPGHRREEG